MEGSSLLVSRVAKPWQRRAVEALAVAARAFGPVDVAWKGRHFWLRGSRNLGRGVL